MVGSMPYSLEKGPYFSVIEDFANSSALGMLDALRAPSGREADQ